MSHARFNALQSLENRMEPLPADFVEGPAETIASYFAENVFGDEAMKKYLPENAYLTVKAAVQIGAARPPFFAARQIRQQRSRRWQCGPALGMLRHWSAGR